MIYINIFRQKWDLFWYSFIQFHPNVQQTFKNIPENTNFNESIFEQSLLMPVHWILEGWVDWVISSLYMSIIIIVHAHFSMSSVIVSSVGLN